MSKNTLEIIAVMALGIIAARMVHKFLPFGQAVPVVTTNGGAA